MLNAAPDSTYYLVQILELARGSYYEQRVGELVGEQAVAWPQPRVADSTKLSTTRFTHANSSAVASGAKGAESGVATELGTSVVVLAARDPWLVATWNFIADHRDLAPGWDGVDAVAPERELLDTAEALAILISAKPMRARPQFSVDIKGRPSFALYDDRLYLHLTIDSADRLSWYSVSGGEEFFEDDIAFDGTQLPPALDRLL